MKRDSKRYLVDFILCFLISSGLSVNVFAGYDMNDPWSGNLYVVAGTVTVLLLILFSAYCKRTGFPVSVPVTMMILIGSAGALYYTEAFSDTGTIDTNPLLFWVIVIAVTTAVFWLARARAGIVILFLSGTIMTAAFDFLKYPVSVRGYGLFLIGTFALFLLRVYFLSQEQYDACRNRFRAYFIQLILVSFTAFLLAGGIYFGVIKPLNPPVDDVQLAQRLMSMDILEKIGVSSKIVISGQPEDTAGASQSQSDEYRKDQNSGNKKTDHNEGGRIGKSKSLMEVMSITYKKNRDKILVTAVILILALLSSIMTKRLLRKKWYGGLRKKTREDCAMELYLYFLKKMRKAGFKRPEGLTLLEYAFQSKEKLEKFSVYDASFLLLTQIYQKMLYGYQKISNEECELFHDFYSKFHKNLRNEMGKFKYGMRYFMM